MAVEEVPAFKTTDGRCWPTKAEAVHEEIVLLCANLRKLVPEKTGFTVKEFRRVVEKADEWLNLAQGLLVQVDGEKDAEVAHRVKGGE